MTTLPTDLPRITVGTLETLEPVARPKPLTSLVASARRITAEQLEGRVFQQTQDWQADAWEMFDLVGEHRYLTTTLAGRLSQARLYVGRRPAVETDDPEQPPRRSEEAQIVKVSEVLARAQAGLILEGIEASLYSYADEEEGA